MFGHRLRKTRNNNGCSQAVLAKALGVSQQSVAKWESGKAYPQPRMLLKIAEFFNVSADFLLGSYAKEPRPSIPILGYVRGGFGQEAVELPLGEEQAYALDPELYFYLTVRGNSMEPYIHEGDLALVRRQNTLQNGQLGVVVYGDEEVTLKRFFKNDSQIILSPFHPDYEPLTLSGEALHSFRILGRVVETKTIW